MRQSRSVAWRQGSRFHNAATAGGVKKLESFAHFRPHRLWMVLAWTSVAFSATVACTKKQTVSGNANLKIPSENVNTPSPAVAEPPATPAKPAKIVSPIVLKSLPPAETNLTELSVTIDGSDIKFYKFALLLDAQDCKSAQYGSWLKKDQPISAKLQKDGFYRLCAVGKDESENEQIEPTTATWTLDSTAPKVFILTPANSTAFVSPLNVSGSCETGLPVEMSGEGLTESKLVDCNDGVFSTLLPTTASFGAKAFQVSQTDKLGNRGSQSYTYVSTYSYSAITSFSDSSAFEFDTGLVSWAGGKAAVLTTDRTDDTNTADGFAGGTHRGTQYGMLLDGSQGLKMAATSDEFALNSNWAPQWSSLAAYWNFDGTLGALSNLQSIDSAAPGPHCSVVDANSSGGVQLAQAVHRQGVSFAGSDSGDSIVCTPTTSVAGNYSLSFWFKANTTKPNQSLFSSRGLSSQPHFFELKYEAGALRASVSSDTVTTDILFNTFTIEAGQWHHYAITVTPEEVSLYFNGRSLSHTPSPFAAGVLSRLWDPSARIVFGKSFSDSDGFGTDGTLDEVGVWASTLSASEIAGIYDKQRVQKSGMFVSRLFDSQGWSASENPWQALAWDTHFPFSKPLPDKSSGGMVASEQNTIYPLLPNNALTAGLEALYHLDTDLTDSTAKHVALNWKGSSAQTFTNIAGHFALGSGAVDMNSQNGHPQTQFGFSRTESFTTAFWIRRDTVGGQIHPLLFTSTSGWQSNGIRLFANTFGQTPGDGKISLQVDDGNTYNAGAENWTSCFPTSPLFLTNAWNHIALSVARDEPNNTAEIKVYLQGDLLCTASIRTVDFQTSTLSYGGPLDTLGSVNTPGELDEIGIWSRVLSANEISSLYKRGANRARFQVRMCDTSDCLGRNWAGPDGTDLSYFSEAQNKDASGFVKLSTPNLSFADFTSQGFTLSRARYFQYRLFLESWDTSATLLPEIRSVKVAPALAYVASSPSIQLKTGQSFHKLVGFSETLGSSGCSQGIRYQLSTDGNVWKYWNGTAWTPSNLSWSQANSAAEINSSVSSFLSGILSQEVRVRALLGSDGTQACELSQVSIQGLRS